MPIQLATNTCQNVRQADTPASELRHHPNQNSANDDLLSFPGTRDMFDREQDYVNNTWDYNTPDLHVVTPLKADAFAFELRYHPDQAFVKQLLKGITEGFEIGYLGPECSRESPNLKSARDNWEAVSAYLQKECKLGKDGGPVPFPLFLTNSAIPLVLSQKRSWRNFAPFYTFLTLQMTPSMISFPRTNIPCITSH